MSEPAFLADLYYAATLSRFVHPDTAIITIISKVPELNCLRLTVLVTPKGKQTVELKHTLDIHRWANIPETLIAQLMLIG